MLKQVSTGKKNDHMGGQSVVEYFVFTVVILIALLAVGIVGPRIRTNFSGYFTNMASQMR
jgi:Flp pilus assembly pilin Flp